MAFRGYRGHATHLPRYCLVSLVGLGLNVLITYVVVDTMGLWYGIALIIVVTTVLVITYLLNRHWICRSEAGAGPLAVADAAPGRMHPG